MIVERTVGTCPLEEGLVRVPSLRRVFSGFVRRAIDIVVSSVVLTLSAPLIGAVALGVRATMGSPILFRQYRVGQGGKPFILLKFRTMRHASPTASGLASDDGARATTFGTLLRRYRIDELPELINILRGEMSLVGPRPLIPETESYYVAPYAQQAWARRHTVRPGLTGWGQVNGNTLLAFSQRFALDVWYIDHCGPLTDFGVMLRTLCTCFRGEHTNAEAVETAERYVFTQRERERIRLEPRACDLAAPVGKPVAGEAASRLRPAAVSPLRKAWQKPTICHLENSSGVAARLSHVRRLRPRPAAAFESVAPSRTARRAFGAANVVPLRQAAAERARQAVAAEGE